MGKDSIVKGFTTSARKLGKISTMPQSIDDDVVELTFYRKMTTRTGEEVEVAVAHKGVTLTELKEKEAQLKDALEEVQAQIAQVEVVK